MNKMVKPNYAWEHPLFLKNPLYKRLAKEHVGIAELDSDVIRVEVSQTRGDLMVPEVYHVHYFLNSITGIDEQQQPILGKHHVVEITFPKNYPVEPPKMFVKKELTGTNIWHPNIKWKGAFEGRICGNIKDFGKGFDLYQLVLRIAEIIQYKNYHALHTPPFPEDSEVAGWVVEYAERNNVINKDKRIVIDNTPLIKGQPEDDSYQVWSLQSPGAEAPAMPPADDAFALSMPAPEAPLPLPDDFFSDDWTAPSLDAPKPPAPAEVPAANPPAEEKSGPFKLRILGKSAAPANRESTIKIKKKED